MPLKTPEEVRLGRGLVVARAQQFSNLLITLAGSIEKNIEKVVTKTVMDVYSEIAEGTPVDTGRAKASWSLGSEQRYDVMPEDTQLSSSGASHIIKEKQEEFKFVMGQNRIVIYNNVAYIEPLEAGHSKQQPSGWISMTMHNFTRRLNKNLKKAGIIK
jgi:hypothetical protein